MLAKADNTDRRSDHGAQGVLQSSIYSQPWWCGVGNSPSFSENSSKSSSGVHLNGSVGNGAIQSPSNTGLDTGAKLNRDTQMAGASQSEGSNGHEYHLKNGDSSAAALTSGHLEPNSQMELVGHSIVLASHPYMDPQYSGMLTSYGAPAMVPPQLYGMPHARMPLRLEMEEEPVYVNAKQFHGILRRRQARAKAELAKKAIKVRKPYLHESRHQHAMKRARGCGGRFLNTKNPDNIADKQTLDKSVHSGASLSDHSCILSGSELFSDKGSGEMESSDDRKEGKGSTVQDMQAKTSSNGNGNIHGHTSYSMYWVIAREAHMEMKPSLVVNLTMGYKDSLHFVSLVHLLLLVCSPFQVF